MTRVCLTLAVLVLCSYQLQQLVKKRRFGMRSGRLGYLCGKLDDPGQVR